VSNLIELTFQTDDGPMVIQIGAPVATPESLEPWSVVVHTNGRPQTVIGQDPLQALASAVHFASHYLSGRDGLDPPVAALAAPVPKPPARGAKP
jgi:hypothetical protein